MVRIYPGAMAGVADVAGDWGGEQQGRAGAGDGGQPSRGDEKLENP